jgi:WD40 repeat protein
VLPDTPHLVLNGFVVNVCFLALKGDLLAAAGEDTDGTVDVLNWRTGDLILHLKHGERLTALAMNEKIVVSAGNFTIRVWDLISGELAWEVSPRDFVEALALNTDVLVSANQSGSVRRWDWRSGKEIDRARQGYSGRPGIVSINGDVIVSGSRHECVLRRWHVATGELLGELSLKSYDYIAAWAINGDTVLYRGVPDDLVRSCNMITGAPLGDPLRDDGPILAVKDIAAIGDYDGVIGLWDLVTGRPTGPDLRGHQGQVLSLSIGDEVVASGGADSTVRIWERKALPIGRPEPLSARVSRGSPNPNHVNALALIDDLLVSAGADGTVCTLDRRTGRLISNLQVPSSDMGPLMSNAWDAEALSIAVSEEIVICAARNGLWRWRRATGELVSDPFKTPQEVIRAVATAGELLLAVDTSGFVQLWNSRTGVALGELAFPSKCPIRAISAHRDIVVTADHEGCVRLWDAREGRALREVRRLEHPPTEQQSFSINDLAVSDRLVAAGDANGAVLVWNRETGKLIAQPQQTIFNSPKSYDPYAATPVAINGSLIAYETDRGVGLWDTETNRLLLEIHLGSTVNDLLINDTSLYVACFNGILRLDIV